MVMIIAGILFMTSNGQPEKHATARRAIIYGLIGLVIVLLAAAITNFVINTLS
jgi:NAD/NADP transhydrogenase beta subunit